MERRPASPSQGAVPPTSRAAAPGGSRCPSRPVLHSVPAHHPCGGLLRHLHDLPDLPPVRRQLLQLADLPGKPESFHRLDELQPTPARPRRSHSRLQHGALRRHHRPCADGPRALRGRRAHGPPSCVDTVEDSRLHPRGHFLGRGQFPVRLHVQPLRRTRGHDPRIVRRARRALRLVGPDLERQRRDLAGRDLEGSRLVVHHLSRCARRHCPRRNRGGSCRRGLRAPHLALAHHPVDPSVDRLRSRAPRHRRRLGLPVGLANHRGGTIRLDPCPLHLRLSASIHGLRLRLRSGHRLVARGRPVRPEHRRRSKCCDQEGTERAWLSRSKRQLHPD